MSEAEGAGRVLDFLVGRDDLHRTRVAESSLPSTLVRGQALLAIDTFALTANNITYAVFGDAMGYWSFFPAPEGWGRVPVWGFADVVGSAHEKLEVGARLYGYFPMSTHLVVEPEGAGPHGFTDHSAHRRALPAIYNQYTNTATDPAYDAAREVEQMVFRPLFLTAFLIDDFLAANRFFGASRVLLSSASSKTALGLAFQLYRNRGGECEVVGLTSRANAGFVEALGSYHRVIAYDDLASLSASTPTVFVDMAGDARVLRAVHGHFGANLKYSCMVGATHWDRTAPGLELPGVQPILFFAPTYAAERVEEWGAAAFQARTGEAWRRFVVGVGDWMQVVEQRGPAAVERVYREILDGRAKPSQAHLLSLDEA